MEPGKEFYLASVSYGQVLSYQAKGVPSTLTAQVKGDQDKPQKWTVEVGEQPNIVALKNSATGTYLHCFDPRNGGRVGLGELQWWMFDNTEVNPPGAFRFYPVQHPGMCLNHHGGGRVNPHSYGQKVHMWQWVAQLEFCGSWYFHDANGSIQGPQAALSVGSGGDSQEIEAKLKDVEAREAALQQKAQELARKQKDADALVAQAQTREENMRSKSDDLAAREESLKRKESEQAEQQQRQQTDNEAKAKELKDREDAIAQRESERVANDASAQDYERKLLALQAREKNVAEREKQVQNSQSDGGSRSGADGSHAAESSAAKAKELDARERDLEVREQALKEKEAKYQGAAGNSATSASDGASSDDRVKQLQARVKDLEQQLAHSKSQSPTNRPSMSRPSASGPSRSGPPTTRPPSTRPTAWQPATNGSSSHRAPPTTRPPHPKVRSSNPAGRSKPPILDTSNGLTYKLSATYKVWN